MRSFFPFTSLLSVGLAVLMSCAQGPNQTDGTDQSQPKSEPGMEPRSVMEIAIRKVKEGQEDAFATARTTFIHTLKMQEGVQKDWEFKSFFTMPEPDDTDVFVGMTRYESLEAMQAIAGKLMQSPEAGQFFSTFDMKSFVAVQPVDGGDFRLEDHIQNGNVLEVAVRTVKTGSEDEFEPKRRAFFDLIARQPGYLFDREFVDVQTGDKVVLIGWSSMEDFQKGAGFLQGQPQMGDFFGILDVKAYQALMLFSK